MAKGLVAATAASAGISYDEFEGKLLVIEPLEVEKGIETVHGTTDAIRGNVYAVLSKDGSKVEEFEDTLIFPRVLQGQLRKAVGKSLVFGRLVKGEKKPGKNAPWTLADPTPADTKAATAFWNSRALVGASVDADDDAEYEDDSESF